MLFCIFYLHSWWYVLQNSGYLLLRKWSDMLYFKSVFAEMYCIIMVIYCYGNVILHILPHSWWYILQNSGYLLLRKWSDMLYFNSVFAETYCIIMVIYCYGNVILHILSAFMVIRNPFPLLLDPSLILKTRVQNFRLANLTFNWFPLENNLKIKLPFVCFPPNTKN